VTNNEIQQISLVQKEVYLKKGLSPIYTLQLAAKFGFQPRTLKPDNIGPPTLKKVQLSTFLGFTDEQ